MLALDAVHHPCVDEPVAGRLDAGHAATTLAVASGLDVAHAFVRTDAAARLTVELYWLATDTAGFLPPPGQQTLFSAAAQLERLDAWFHRLVALHQ